VRLANIRSKPNCVSDERDQFPLKSLRIRKKPLGPDNVTTGSFFAYGNRWASDLGPQFSEHLRSLFMKTIALGGSLIALLMMPGVSAPSYQAVPSALAGGSHSGDESQSYTLELELDANPGDVVVLFVQPYEGGPKRALDVVVADIDGAASLRGELPRRATELFPNLQLRIGGSNWPGTVSLPTPALGQAPESGGGAEAPCTNLNGKACFCRIVGWNEWPGAVQVQFCFAPRLPLVGKEMPIAPSKKP
jgi:hypothetical protein